MPVKFITEVVKGLFGISEADTEESAETETSITVERETDDEAGSETAVESEAGEERAESEEEQATEAAETDEQTTEAAEETAVAGADESVGEITGIGPTYSERLAEVGIETVADLDGADAAEVAAAAQVSESRAADWITQAEEW